MASQQGACLHNGAMVLLKPRPLLTLLLLVLCAFAAGAADARKSSGKQLEKMLFEYSSTIRWSEYETAWTYVEPTHRSEHPLGEFDLERYAQFQVSGYLVKRRETLNKTEYAQVVEIRFVNRHTQSEKIITERELWRWDAKAKRWWLTTGLPELFKD
jgi:hypothetical protein